MTERKREPPGESLADDLVGDDPEPIGGWRRFDENGKRIPSGPLTPPRPSDPVDEDLGALESDPEGEGLADDMLLGDFEPEGGWHDFDEQGRRVPSSTNPSEAEPPPDSEPEFESEGQSLADELIGSDPEPEDGWLNFDENGKRIPSQPRPQVGSELESDPPDDDLVGDSLSRELLGDDPEPEDGWLDFDEDGNLLPRQPPVPSEWDQKDAPPGTSLAEHLIGDDPEPEDGWLRFDEQGNLLPRKPPPKPEPSKRPAPPPGVGDFSKFISDGSDIRVGSDDAEYRNRPNEARLFRADPTRARVWDVARVDAGPRGREGTGGSARPRSSGPSFADGGTPGSAGGSARILASACGRLELRAGPGHPLSLSRRSVASVARRAARRTHGVREDALARSRLAA